MSNPKGIRFDAFGKRVMKFAEKNLQKGINYLEAPASGANTNYNTPYSYAATQQHPNPGYHSNPAQQEYFNPPSQPPPPGYHSNPAQQEYFNPPSQPPPPSQPQPSQPSPSQPPQFYSTPPPPTPFTEPFPQTQNNPSTSAPTPPDLPNTTTALLNASGPIITQELLLQMQARVPSACVSLGISTVKEARKGLSRVLTSTPQDINLFAAQLKNSQPEAVDPNWDNIDDQFPCFAISYVQHPPQGRYKFSEDQWTNFLAVVQAIAAAGVKQFRVWLDQCLWLRDASQSSWAHTGIVPYVLWPVIALGAKPPGGERTKDSFHRMWPFVEQIAGLWGMGLIIASEYRNQNLVDSDFRSWLSFNLRIRTEPEQDLMIILLNIFHGAADVLETGWVDDVQELKEMANANVMYANKQIIIGSDWKNRFASIPPLNNYSAIDNTKMPIRAEYLGGVDLYLDGSRTLKCSSWHGIREWLSGNEGPTPIGQHDFTMLNIGMDKYNIITNVAEYQLLRRGGLTDTLWLLVTMQGRSSNFSRGRVAWTKVLTGPGSCRIVEMMGNNNISGIQRALREELKNPSLRILSANKVNNEIQWI